jgi:predicted small lipoprotein YifL
MKQILYAFLMLSLVSACGNKGKLLSPSQIERKQEKDARKAKKDVKQEPAQDEEEQQ